MNSRLLFCVFSFNRGRFLEHCIRTIEQCVPEADIAVFDDDSYDDYTRQSLEKLGKKHAVIQPGKRSTHKLGGLYGNMQAALEYAADRKLVCFLQDDMQVVRPLSSEEISGWDSVFDESPRLAFLHPCFLKGVNKSRDKATLDYDAALGVYRRRAETTQSAGRYFSAILITRPSRLLDHGWVFCRNEPENDRKAAEYFESIGHLFAPFSMWLPEVPAYRGKRKTLALKLAEKSRACGFYPYKTMTREEVESLQARRRDMLPVAEEFLKCDNDSLRRPWTYYPLQGNRWLKKLNTLELSLRRLLRTK